MDQTEGAREGATTVEVPSKPMAVLCGRHLNNFLTRNALAYGPNRYNPLQLNC
jgi:hypothetical protein